MTLQLSQEVELPSKQDLPAPAFPSRQRCVARFLRPAPAVSCTEPGSDGSPPGQPSQSGLAQGQHPSISERRRKVLLWASPTPPVSAGSAVLILVQLGSLGLRQEIEAIEGPGVMDVSVKEGHSYSSLEMLPRCRR